ncbi:MAG: hypothetical protein ACYDD1_18590 [Caulobacteraceae bacterium]
MDTGCATATTNSQSPTFTEQKLMSDAGARAVSRDNLVCRSGSVERCVPRGAKTFIRVLAGADKPAGQMAAAEFRQALTPQLAVVDDVKDADVIIDLVVKAAGIDDSDYVVGLASVTIPPIPGKTSASSTTPEISVYSRHIRQGGVELAATATNAHNHVFITAVDLWGATTLRRGSVLTGLTWGRVTDPPGVVATAGR